jgi:hypothetical protein
MTLNVMVLESEHGAADVATRELRAAGHTVLTCHEPGTAPFPCRGVIEASTCPLRSHDIDVALVVRDGTRPQPTLDEDGVRCALVQRVPLVVSGSRVLDPYDEFATRAIDASDDVVAACQQAADAPIQTLGRRATEVLAEVLGTSADSAPRAEVTRRSGRLDVHVLRGEAMSKKERSQAAVRIAMALRELDPFAAGIDVAVEGSNVGPGGGAGAGESTL